MNLDSVNSQTPQIKEGYLHAFLAFDVGFEIRLAQIPNLFPQRQKDPVGYTFLSKSLARDIIPLRLRFDDIELKLVGANRKFECYVTFYDIGAISLEFICEMKDRTEDLPRIGMEIHNSTELVAVAQKLAQKIYEIAKPSIISGDFLGMPSVFVVFDINQWTQKTRSQDLKESIGISIAKTLRLSEEPIGQAEIDRTLNPSITYSDDDIVFCSSNVALVFDETSSDVIDIFELLNVQTLELRLIDSKLDRSLQSLYEETEKAHSVWSQFFNLFDTKSRKLNTIHLDSTIIVERVEQSYKFATDSYMVRIYELGVQKMFLNRFSLGIDKKLQAIRDIITDQRDRASSARMEVLEWIVIILIAVDVVPKLISIFGSK